MILSSGYNKWTRRITSEETKGGGRRMYALTGTPGWVLTLTLRKAAMEAGEKQDRRPTKISRSLTRETLTTIAEVRRRSVRLKS